MTEFKFRLQNVIRLRERERDQAAQAYKQAIAAIEELNSQIANLQQQYESQYAVQANNASGTVNPQKLLDVQRFQLHLKQQIATIRENVQRIEEEKEKRRLHLVTKEQALRSIEKLREKQLAEWTSQQARAEQSTLDEWAGTKYWAKSHRTIDTTPEG